jgi:glycosyltransferase involved in cell wall biosynthesis
MVARESLPVIGEELRTGRTVVLCITPLTPPLGGVAMQSERFLAAEEMAGSFSLSLLRSNPTRAHEDPRCDKRISRGVVAWTIGFLLRALIAGIRKRPRVVYVTTSDDLSFFRSMLGALLAAMPGRGAIVLHFHSRRGQICTPSPGIPPVLSGRPCHILAKWLIRRASAVIQLSDAIDASYKASNLPEACCIVPNCVEIGPSPDWAEKEPHAILFIGRLSMEKGFLDLLEALASPDLDAFDWKLHALGGPPTRKTAEELEPLIAGHRHLNRIVRYGAVAGKTKEDLLRRCSIFVLPSHGEIFPVSLIEAMAEGQAVISTPVGEIAGIPARDGWISVKPGDITGLTGALATLLADDDLRADMGRRNREKAETAYDLHLHAGRIASVIRKVSTTGRRLTPADLDQTLRGPGSD